MASNMSPATAPDALPQALRRWFWDCDFDRLTWSEHREFVVRRVLSEGSWDAVCWVRGKLGDAALRQWIQDRQGRGLSTPQLRFWELILDLPPGLVDTWLDSPGRRIWEGRVQR